MPCSISTMMILCSGPSNKAHVAVFSVAYHHPAYATPPFPSIPQSFQMVAAFSHRRLSVLALAKNVRSVSGTGVPSHRGPLGCFNHYEPGAMWWPDLSLPLSLHCLNRTKTVGSNQTLPISLDLGSIVCSFCLSCMLRCPPFGTTVIRRGRRQRLDQ